VAQKNRTIFGCLIGTGALLMALSPVMPAAAADGLEADDFSESVTVDGIRKHLVALQDIADDNDGNRSAGTSGHEASAEYIEATLADAGYTTERQYFTIFVQAVSDFSLEIPAVTPAIVPAVMQYAPGGTITDAPFSQPIAVEGCDAAAWDGVDATGTIAVVSRGTCTFAEKVVAAAADGALGVLIYDNIEEGPLNGTLGGPTDGAVASFGISLTEGTSLLAAIAADPTITGSLSLEEETTQIDTFNVLAETATGDHDNVVMMGAHLDSVLEGPGINDNGSGSAAILETAVQLAKVGGNNNAVRFAWWGAEEEGLLGSYFYTDDLALNHPEELDKIATYLNFDMVASPNYVISVYDADQSTYESPVEVPEGSIATEDVFTDFFDANGQAWIDTAFDGRSDYDGFIAYGIPASGLFTGADDIKTEEEVALFGGTAGITHDPNYHSVTDDIDNINDEALGIMAKAIAYATASLALDTSAVNGVVPPTTPVPSEPVPSEPVPSEPVPSEPVPSEPVPSVPTPTESATPTPTPTATAAAPAPTKPATPGLAETGFDSSIPFGIGGVMVVGGVLALLLTGRRQKAIAERAAKK